MRPIPLTAILLLAVIPCVAGTGGAITYTMPPGGEGPASVALGVAVPGGLPSMEVNPALLGWEGARTSSILQLSASESELLPALRGDELTETVRSIGLRFPVKPGTDLAIGYSWHAIDFGMNQIPISLTSDSVREVHSTEDVQHLVLAGRLGGIASIGVGMKWLDSRLAPGIMTGDDPSGTAQAFTWDVGVLVAPRWKIPGTPLRMGPSAAMSWINLAEDSISYTDPDLKDPVERVRRWGVSAEMELPDLLSGQVFLDEEVDLATAGARESFEYQGWSMEVLGLYRWSTADLFDEAGSRFETQTSQQYTFDLKQIWRLWWRWQHWDFTTRLTDVPDGYPLPFFKVLGATLWPNVRVTYTQSEIEGHRTQGSKGVRDGQKRLGWSIAL